MCAQGRRLTFTVGYSKIKQGIQLHVGASYCQLSVLQRAAECKSIQDEF